MRTSRDGRPGEAQRLLNPAQPDPLLRYEYDRGSNYEQDTRLTTALAALVPEAELHHPDHRFFQVLHLVTEYSWVAIHQVLCDLAAALDDDRPVPAARLLDRATGLGVLPVQAIRLLSDSLPQLSLLAMRAAFPPNTTGLDSPGARNLRRASRAVWTAFEGALARAGLDLDALSAAAEPRYTGDTGPLLLADVMIGLHRFDARILEWKQVHLNMVWLLLGGQPQAETDPGDADKPSSLRGRSISDLERMAASPMFPLLWQHSTTVFHRMTREDTP
ncbi:hypothetical protein ACWT_6056 [Actinoplanes sp. SE50]|uniref:hypothetical protein n=1 Tax=unclassified Actinoplanes TaxID=2626549 RepID=UPI00023EC86B|nr:MULTISPECIES: hypothetical protein [unclassified Actinoplanes]AEV87073.1 hypothetical protein ACPL_6188 [Actinoplanes sp. SE50/110]ATO85471.1 hypothetical protein ACWT_6056 [Actinoplanes sp. SE50]SLM02883.1 hypothetical protein ACSP50_6168 [Actinoplanes sp. SE50/110]